MSGDNQASNGEQAEESVKPCQNAQGDSCLHAVYVPPEDNEGGAEGKQNSLDKPGDSFHVGTSLFFRRKCEGVPGQARSFASNEKVQKS